MNMLFTINTSPFFGKEGKFVTSRHLRDRLYKEMEKNLALKVIETEAALIHTWCMAVVYFTYLY